MKTIYMVSYNHESLHTPEILNIDGSKFKYDDPFFLICNKPLPKIEVNGEFLNIYYEIIVEDYYPIRDYHHIPLYVGISKEVSNGVFNNDYIIGSLFFEDGKDYDIRYKTKLNPDNIHNTVPDKILCRKAGAKDRVGIGVNFNTNIVTIFVNGKPFYEMDTNKINGFTLDHLRYYFCIYSPIYYKRILLDYNYLSDDEDLEKSKQINGIVYFHPDDVPEGYHSLYGVYETYGNTINGIDDDNDSEFDTWEYDYDKYNGMNPLYEYINCDIGFEPRRDSDGNPLYLPAKGIINNVDINVDTMALETDSLNKVDIEDKYKYKMRPTIDFDGKYYISGSNIFINKPIPKNKLIYIEFTAKQGKLKEGITGIPLSLGITSCIPPYYSIISKSTRFKLFHEHRKQYNWVEMNNQSTDDDTWIEKTYDTDGTERYEDILLDSMVLQQGSTIGVAFNLRKNKIVIYINGTKYYVLRASKYWNDKVLPDGTGKSPGNIDEEHPNGYYGLDYSNLWEYAYFFIHDDGVFLDDGTKPLNGYFNFGQEPFDYPIPDGYMSLWDFYNVNWNKDVVYDILTRVNIVSSKESFKFINCSINILNDPYQDSRFGMNKMIQNHETISDEETHYINLDGVDINAFNSLIAQENNGYIIEDKPASTAISFNGINAYTITVEQVPHQKIFVLLNNRRLYNATFRAPKGSNITSYTVGDSGWDGGTVSVDKTILTEDITITATKATLTEYLVSIHQTDHQQIKVTHVLKKDSSGQILEKNIYTNSFTVTMMERLKPDGTPYPEDEKIYDPPEIYAEISSDTGWDPGLLNITHAIIKKNIVVEATPATIAKITVKMQRTTLHAQYVVICNGVSRKTEKVQNNSQMKSDYEFITNYGSSCVIQYVPNSIDYGYKPGKLEVEKLVVLGNDIIIRFPEPEDDMCKIYLDRTNYNGTIQLLNAGNLINNSYYSVRRGTEVTLTAVPGTDLYNDKITIDESKDLIEEFTGIINIIESVSTEDENTEDGD